MDAIKPPQQSLRGSAKEAASLVRSLLRFGTKRPVQTVLDPRPVLVIPGFMTSDRSTLIMRRYLQNRGHTVFGWELGRNEGNVGALVPRVVHRLTSIFDDVGEPVSLVGWSLGGVLARAVAREIPEAVENIVTMGTPVIGGPKYTAAADFYRKQGYDLDSFEQRIAEENDTMIDAPIVVIYSKIDQVVSWRACLDPNPQNTVTYVETDVGHMAMGFDPNVLETINTSIIAK